MIPPCRGAGGDREMESYVIEKGIPIPAKISFASLLRSLSVGDSIVIEERRRSNLSNSAKAAGIKVKSRTLGDGNRRVWRVA